MEKKMIRVHFPALNLADAFATCLSSVGDKEIIYRERLRRVSHLVTFEWILFSERKKPMQFHLFTPCPSNKDTYKIAGEATKGDFKLLYSRYMVKGRKESRAIYDKLRLASHGKCPLCGINQATTLDHYLPKAHYPILSVYPWNLVPACKDCNIGKSDPVYKSIAELPLYPYGDDIKFYKVDWIKASIRKKDGVLDFDFFPNPPDKWLQVEKNRVVKHFDCYDLKSKYKLNASLSVSATVSTIRMLLEMGDEKIVKKFYTNLHNNERPNTTLRAMYKAIAEDDDICSGKF